jgi:hypothetical protein
VTRSERPEWCQNAHKNGSLCPRLKLPLKIPVIYPGLNLTGLIRFRCFFSITPSADSSPCRPCTVLTAYSRKSASDLRSTCRGGAVARSSGVGSVSTGEDCEAAGLVPSPGVSCPLPHLESRKTACKSCQGHSLVRGRAGAFANDSLFTFGAHKVSPWLRPPASPLCLPRASVPVSVPSFLNRLLLKDEDTPMICGNEVASPSRAAP